MQPMSNTHEEGKTLWLRKNTGHVMGISAMKSRAALVRILTYPLTRLVLQYFYPIHIILKAATHHKVCGQLIKYVVNW